MRSLYLAGLMAIAAIMLVFCGDDGDDGDKPAVEDAGSGSGYALKIGGIATHATKGTDLKVTVDIMYNDKLATEGAVASTKVSLAIKCGDDEVAEQKDVAAKAGKVEFAAIKTEDAKFAGDCTLTLKAKLAGEDVKIEHKFNFVAEDVLVLPDPPTDGGDDDDYVPPVLSSVATVGRPFIVPSAAATLKVQPDSLCKGNLVLIYYNDSNKTVREVLTAGETIKPVKGAVSGLAVVKARPDVDVAKACEDEDAEQKRKDKKEDEILPPSIVIAISPGFPKGLRLEVKDASDAASLIGNAFSSGNNSKMKFTWTDLSGFEGGAGIFFNNKTEGNEWTKHSGNITWTKSSGTAGVTSTLAYVLPVKALIQVKPTGNRAVPHWLYFKGSN